MEKLELLAPYIICTHLHDNNSQHDMHKPAFIGNIEWENVVDVLKRHHYAGDLSWEFVYERIPDALYGDYLKFIHATGCFLLQQMGK